MKKPAAAILSLVHYLFSPYPEGMEDRTIVLNVTFKAALIANWQWLELECEPCGVTVRFGLAQLRERTKHRVISDYVARARCRFCGEPPAKVFLMRRFEDADPFQFLRFRVEEWAHDGQHVEAIKAACYSVTAGWAAYHAVVKDLPGRHITYRIGAWLFASTRPEPQPTPPNNVVPMPKRGNSEAARPTRTRRHRSRFAPF